MKDKEFMRSFGYSLFIHSLLLVLLVHNRMFAPGSPPNGGPQQDQQEQTAEAEKKYQQTTQVEIIDPPKKEEEAQAKTDKDGIGEVAHASDLCPDFFGGIGITQQYLPSDEGGAVGKMYVAIVHHGYPAEAAGIQYGDELINHKDIRGEIGTHVTVIVKRNGELLSFDIVRDKICTESLQKGNEP